MVKINNLTEERENLLELYFPCKCKDLGGYLYFSKCQLLHNFMVSYKNLIFIFGYQASKEHNSHKIELQIWKEWK